MANTCWYFANIFLAGDRASVTELLSAALANIVAWSYLQNYRKSEEWRYFVLGRDHYIITHWQTHAFLNELSNQLFQSLIPKHQIWPPIWNPIQHPTQHLIWHPIHHPIQQPTTWHHIYTSKAFQFCYCRIFSFGIFVFLFQCGGLACISIAQTAADLRLIEWRP